MNPLAYSIQLIAVAAPLTLDEIEVSAIQSSFYLGFVKESQKDLGLTANCLAYNMLIPFYQWGSDD